MMHNVFFNEKILRIFLPVGVIIISVGIALFISMPEEKKRAKKNEIKDRPTPVVDAVNIEKTDIAPRWSTLGSVIASERIALTSGISGEIVELNSRALPGAVLKEGEWLAKLDTEPFLFALQRAQSQLTQAQSRLSIEQGQQAIAKQEYELLKSSFEGEVSGEELTYAINDSALVLREPQLASVKAAVDSARINVRDAERNLKRTSVKMPFLGQIVAQNIGTASRVGQTTNLFEVVNVSSFWVEAKVPRSFYELLDLEAEIYISQPRAWGESVKRLARIESVMAEVGRNDRQIQLLIAIDDPLALKDESGPSVFINDLVQIDVVGKEISNVFKIKPSLVLADNSIWVVDQNNELRRRSVDIVYKGQDYFFVDANISHGEKVVSEKIAVAKEGMSVKIRNRKKEREKESQIANPSVSGKGIKKS